MVLNNVSLHGTQGRNRTTSLMNFFRSNCITGLHLRDLIEGHKPYMGCSGTLLSNIFPALVKFITQLWITNTRQFIWKKLVLEEETPNMNKQRRNDSHIIACYLKTGIQGEELAELNIWWMFLHAPVGIWVGSDWTWKSIKILSCAFDFVVHARMKSLLTAYFYKIYGRCKAEEDVKIDGRCKSDEDEWDGDLIKLK